MNSNKNDKIRIPVVKKINIILKDIVLSRKIEKELYNYCINKCKINPLLHVCSSSEVFGKVSNDKLPIDEKCNFHPASPYAISKVGTDLIGRYFFALVGNCI